MVEMGTVVFRRQNIKAHRPLFFDRDERYIRAEEFRPHRKGIVPGCDPAFRITPMPLRRVGDFRQWFGVFRLCADDFDHSCSTITNVSMELAEEKARLR
jgi:hypothetical protein